MQDARTLSSRRKLHIAINALTHAEVAAIVRQQYPRARGKEIDELARQMVGQAHSLVSPRGM